MGRRLLIGEWMRYKYVFTIHNMKTGKNLAYDKTYSLDVLKGYVESGIILLKTLKDFSPYIIQIWIETE